ncbi:MAG: hypothetical protein U0271_47605 [Polyangiaceae bacterium]
MRESSSAGAVGSDDLVREPISCVNSNITVTIDDREYELTQSPYAYEPRRTAQAELLYNTENGSPNLSGWASSADGVYVHLLGHVPSVPGSIEEAEVRLQLPGDPDYRTSTRASIRVTSMGPAGDRIAGRFRAEISARLNQAPTAVTGTFCLDRGVDRSGP